MKKTLLILLISFVILPLSLYAQSDDVAWADEDDIVEEIEAIDDFEEEAPPKEKKPRGPVLGIKRRVEVGFMDINVGFGNNFLTTEQIFKDKLVINLDDLSNGLNLNFGLALSPLYFNYISKNEKWGFGISTKVEAIGALGISGNMLTFKEDENENSDIGGAAFAEIGLHGFFHVDKFKIKVKPALYYPIAYIDSDIKYTYKNTLNDSTAETRLKLGFDVSIYTIGSFEDGFGGVTATPGVDFYLGAEYPLSEALGLKEKFFFLDFDVGLDIVNLPMIPSSMSDYMQIKGKIGGDDPIDFIEPGAMDDFADFEDGVVWGNKKKDDILRPFKMVAWAHWRPFGDRFVSFFPSLGFAVNPLYKEPGSIEAGIKARLDMIKFFIVTAGTVYEDRMWKNSIDLALDLRAFELDLGASLCAPDFAKSWTGGGFGAHLGFKFGW